MSHSNPISGQKYELGFLNFQVSTDIYRTVLKYKMLLFQVRLPQPQPLPLRKQPACSLHPHPSHIGENFYFLYRLGTFPASVKPLNFRAFFFSFSMLLHYNSVFCFASFSTLIDFFGGFFSLIDRKYVADFSETAALKCLIFPPLPPPVSQILSPIPPALGWVVLYLSPFLFFPYFMIVKQAVSVFRDFHMAVNCKVSFVLSKCAQICSFSDFSSNRHMSKKVFFYKCLTGTYMYSKSFKTSKQCSGSVEPIRYWASSIRNYFTDPDPSIK